MSRKNITQELRQVSRHLKAKKVVYDQEQQAPMSISERKWNMSLDDMIVT